MLGIKQEPTIVINSLSEMLRQLLPSLVILGIINISSEKQAALSVAIGLILGFFTTLFTRSQTVAIATADRQMEIAKVSPADRPTKDIIKAAKEDE